MGNLSRCLPYFKIYIYICVLEADDDGVVEAFLIMNLINATEQDLQMLEEKKYIIILDEDYVVYICDWRTHNSIRADRKIDSIYKELLLEKIPDIELLEKKQRSDVKRKHEEMTVDCPLTAEDSVVEDRKDEDRINESISEDGVHYLHKLGEEHLTNDEYQYLVNKYNSKLVDSVVNRILEHPYWNCLNIPKIEEWCEERMNTQYKNQGKKSNVKTFERNYDMDKLESQLLNVKAC